MKAIWRVGRNKEDPEKAVTPVIIYLSASHADFAEYQCAGAMIAVGWWDFSIKFGLIWKE